MEFVARKTDLLRELAILQGCAQPNNHLPILSHVRLEAEEGGQLRFAATDLQVGMTTGCAATVTVPGVLALPARSFFDIVRSFPDTDIKVVTTANGAIVTADKYDGHMVALPAGDFPMLPDVVVTPKVTLDKAAMRDSINRVLFATSHDVDRYYLNGAQLELTPEALTMVATDGHRLAIASTARTTPDGEEAPPATKTILARKTLLELLRLLNESASAEFSYTAAAAHVFFHVGDRLLTARTVDGTFPAYDRIIPKTTPLHFEFNRANLITALRRVAILADGRSRAVKLTFKKGKCEVTAMCPERGEAVEPLPCTYTKKESLTVNFSSEYLLQGLMACGTDAVTLGITDDLSPVLITPINPAGYSYTYVVMPMRG